MGLQISQTYGQIGIDTYRSRMDIEQTPPKAHIEQKPPNLNIDRQLPKVQIDQTQCFAESGLKPALQLAHDFYEEGIQVALEAIGRISQEGTRMMAIENGGNSIADIALENSIKEYEVGMVQMPKSRPDIQWDMGYLDITWRPNTAKIEWETYTKAKIDANPYRVDIYMKQWPDIRMEYIGDNVDKII